jgi:hypothetical protein
MVTYTPTTGVLVVKAPQYVEEATYGTTPTASPTLLWIGANADVNPQVDMDVQDVLAVAHEDPVGALPGKQQPSLSLQFALQSSTFLKYGIAAQGGGSGTIDKSLSILWTQMLNGVENYMVAAGCRVNTLKLVSSAGKPIIATADIFAKSIIAPTSSDPLTTPTFATDPATIPWNFVDGGAGNVTLNSVVLDVTDIEVDLERNLERVHVLGATQQAYLVPKTRKVSGTFTAVFEASTDFTTMLGTTEYTLAWVLKSATSTLTISNVSLRKLSSLEIKPDNVTYEKFAFEGRGVAIT